MANRFSIWDENATNIQTYSEFANDAQRQAGFQSGQLASSIRVNSALRQANLVICALMNVIAPNDDTIDLSSQVSAAQTVVENGLKQIKVNNATNADNCKNIGQTLLSEPLIATVTGSEPQNSITGTFITSSTLIKSNALYLFDLELDYSNVQRTGKTGYHKSKKFKVFVNMLDTTDSDTDINVVTSSGSAYNIAITEDVYGLTLSDGAISKIDYLQHTPSPYCRLIVDFKNSTSSYANYNLRIRFGITYPTFDGSSTDPQVGFPEGTQLKINQISLLNEGL